MRGHDEQTTHMFSYLSPEQRVPADHPLRAVRALTDEALQTMSRRFASLYATTGRPSIPPEQWLRALLLQVLYTVRSERLPMEELTYNRFCCKVWDHARESVGWTSLRGQSEHLVDQLRLPDHVALRHPSRLWVANYYSARNPLRLSSLVILGVVARMFRCACQWQTKTAHFWQLKTAHVGEIHLRRSGRSSVDVRRAFWAGRRERSDRSPGQHAPRSCAAGGHVATPSRCCSDAARSQC